jgi:hypothetical protein
MGKHINILGYSLWLSGEAADQGSKVSREPEQSLYSPSALAGYALLSPGIAMILYGMNLYRRDEQLKGKCFIVLSCIFVFLNVVVKQSRQPLFLFSTLIALSLYQIEKPHFDRAIRDGFHKARWWPPLIGTLVLLAITVALGMLFP